MIGVARAAVNAAYHVEKDPAAFVLSETTYADEKFAADTGQFSAPFTTGTAGSFAVGGGVGAITNTAGTTRQTYVKTGAFLSATLPYYWVQCDVVARSAAQLVSENTKIGIGKDGGNLIYADYRRFDTGGALYIVVRVGSVDLAVIQLATGIGALAAPFKIALSIYNNILSAYLDTGTGWARRGSYDCTSILNLAATNLSTWQPTFGVSSDTSNTSVVSLDNFKAYAAQAYFDFQPTALRWVNEAFTSDTGQFGALISGGVLSLAAGVGTITHSAAQEDLIAVGTAITMPQVCVTCDITARTGTPTTNTVSIGIGRDSNNYLVAEYLHTTGALRVTSKIAGVVANDASVSLALTAPFKLAFTALENQVSAWVDRGNGWERITGLDISARIDMRAADLSTWRGVFGHKSDGASTWAFDNFRVGRFGAIALHDMCMVTTLDGRPYIANGLAYFTATAAEPIDSYQGVFSLNLSTYAIAQTGVLFASRGGLTRMDKAGHLVVFPDGTQHWFTSTWSGATTLLGIQHGSLAGDLINGAHVVATTALALPNIPAGGGSYDPFLIKVGASYLLAYTPTTAINPLSGVFYPALAQSSDLLTWTAVGVDASRSPYEGTRILRTRGNTWVLSGGFSDGHVYSDTMAFTAALSMLPSQTQSLPHPMIFLNGDRQILLTFDEVRYLSTSNPSRGLVRIMTGKRFVH